MCRNVTIVISFLQRLITVTINNVRTVALASTLLMATDVTAPQDLKGATVKVGYFAKMQGCYFPLTMEEKKTKGN